MVQVLSPRQWAQRQFGQTQLGDIRRTRRVVSFATAAARSPSRSIPRQCGGVWKQTKGAYRLLDNSQVTFDKLQEPHRRQTLELAATRAVVLWISDTTTLSFDHPATSGLGPTSSGGSGQGILLHTTMGVDVSGGIDQSPFVLGLGHQHLWVRPTGSGKNKTPESAKWAEGIEAVGPAPHGVQWVHVGDAESDCWEAIESCRKQSMGFAVRACQNRQIIAGHVATSDAGEKTLLFDRLQQEPALGKKKLWVRGRGDRKSRWAQLAVSALPVTLLAPKNWAEKDHRKNLPRPEPIRCWAVRVWEIDAPQGVEPIEWVIMTDEAATDLATALKVVHWYSCRWLIEEYHKCLKTGCRIESSQLEQARRIESLVGIKGIVAVRLLQLKHQAKMNPDAPAKTVIPEIYVQTLAAYLKQSPAKLTTREFWRSTAQLGGFLCRKGDGDPGWITLWRGWEELETMTLGVELAGKMKYRCG